MTITTRERRQVNSLQRRIHSHAKSNCANHTGDDGCIMAQHGKCVLSFEADRVTANVCPYYMRSVGESNVKLFDEYLRFFPVDYPIKSSDYGMDKDQCAKCGEDYVRNSNRQIYCKECSAEIRRNKERERQAKRRAIMN